MNDGKEPCWCNGGKDMVEGSGARPGLISRSCCDDGSDEPIDGSRYLTGIWIGDPDSECSGSETEGSALEAGNDHDNNFAL